MNRAMQSPASASHDQSTHTHIAADQHIVPLRVLYLMEGFDAGGAERRFVRMARGLDRERFALSVAALRLGGPLETEMRACGVPIVPLERRGRFDVQPVLRLRRYLRAERIQVVHAMHWLSNLTAAGLAQAGLPFTITNVHDHILPNNVVQITGDVPILGGIEIRRLSATATLTVEQGHVALHVKKASVGGFDLPAVVTDAIESSFNARSAELTNSLNVDSTHYAVSGISSSTGKLTLRLKRAP